MSILPPPSLAAGPPPPLILRVRRGFFAWVSPEAVLGAGCGTDDADGSGAWEAATKGDEMGPCGAAAGVLAALGAAGRRACCCSALGLASGFKMDKAMSLAFWENLSRPAGTGVAAAAAGVGCDHGTTEGGVKAGAAAAEGEGRAAAGGVAAATDGAAVGGGLGAPWEG